MFFGGRRLPEISNRFTLRQMVQRFFIESEQIVCVLQLGDLSTLSETDRLFDSSPYFLRLTFSRTSFNRVAHSFSRLNLFGKRPCVDDLVVAVDVLSALHLLFRKRPKVDHPVVSICAFSPTFNGCVRLTSTIMEVS